MDIYEGNNVNIKKMYKYKLEDLNKDEYEKYLKYLNFFFAKPHSKDKCNRAYMNGKYVLIDKTKSSKKITITPTEFVNIHSMYLELKEYCDLILFKINNLIETKSNITEDHRYEFDTLKKNYMSAKEKLKDIETINDDYYKEIETSFDKKINLSNEMAKYYQKRNDAYYKIEVFISESLKKKLIYMYKVNNKKIPSLSIINKVSKENGIPSIEIEKWFDWIESVYQYMSIKMNLNKLDDEIREIENNFDMNTKYMVIKKPVIEE